MDLDELTDGWLRAYMDEDLERYPVASRERDLALLRDSPGGEEVRYQLARHSGQPYDGLARALGKRRNTSFVSLDQWWKIN